MIALDTETTGVDLRHDALPFFVTICDEGGEVRFWEWEVDPLTRNVRGPRGDLDEILLALDFAGEGEVVLQNSKFDVAALNAVDEEVGELWRWDRTHDTLIAGHVLHSGRDHDLTSMILQYLGHDIEPLELKLRDCCLEARRVAAARFPEWKLAKKGVDGMPSAKDKSWKYDTWLPKRLAQELGHPDDHPWWACLEDYANADSEATLALWGVMRKELERRDLWEIYLVRLQSMRLAYGMEHYGATLNRDRKDWIKGEYQQESARYAEVCKSIARSYDYPLELPKAANNHSLTYFCFGEPLLPTRPVKPKKPRARKGQPPPPEPEPQPWASYYNQLVSGRVRRHLDLPVLQWTDAGSPQLDKEVMEAYRETLKPRSKQWTFVEALSRKRKRDTGVSYIEVYERHWVPLGVFNERGEQLWYRLHPSFNPTGSATLRWSCSNPNEQNISKQGMFEGDDRTLRQLFGPAPGREWYSLDARNIERRLPAYVANEVEIIALFERPNDPPYYGSEHLLVAHILHPEKFEQTCRLPDGSLDGRLFKKKYGNSLYQRIKNGNFAVQYQAVDRPDGLGTADRTYGIPGAQSRLKHRFHRQEALVQETIRFAERHGYVETLPDRTVNPRRGYPLECARTDYGRIKPTVPFNYKFQGSAMWWMTKAMIRCQDQLDDWNKPVQHDIRNKGIFITMQIHDELVFDFPKRVDPRVDPKRSNLPRVLALARLMEEGGRDFIPQIPTPVNIEYHPETWAVGITMN